MLHRTADAEKYTQLLLSHVNKSFSGLKNFLFIGIGNMDVLKNLIKATDDKCNIYIIDEPCLCKWFSLITWKDGTTRSVKGIDYDIENFKKDDFDKVLNAESYSLNETMKFDYIIMNPPYEKNLHLKILESVIDHIDDNGEIINLSPVRWLQDPLAKYKKNSDYNKFENTVAKHIESLDIVPLSEACNIFSAEIRVDLGIYKITKKLGIPVCETTPLQEKLVKKLFMMKSVNDVSEVNPKQNFIKFISGASTIGHGKVTSATFLIVPIDFTNATSFTKTSSHIVYINDLSKVQQINIHNCYKTEFMKYWSLAICSATALPKYTPWLGDTENHRTHKIGYESDWTNEDLCNVFGITGYISDTKAVPGSEWEEVLKTMEKYV